MASKSKQNFQILCTNEERMPHTLDLARLGEVFEALEADDGQHLTAWEIDRLSEWKSIWESGRGLSEKQLECLERMYCKV